ncbi:hypothetical protein EGW08_013397 [Elysia chlorotica]|uniref:Uncharacterized protein n=1 Tax=Elysia chlorotica TaxID=188477 RepID=A0A433TB85_ELYCH|nr:hypothetical protein EGW08_013397 [Elysia chlorotica]
MIGRRDKLSEPPSWFSLSSMIARLLLWARIKNVVIGVIRRKLRTPKAALHLTGFDYIDIAVTPLTESQPRGKRSVKPTAQTDTLHGKSDILSTSPPDNTLNSLRTLAGSAGGSKTAHVKGKSSKGKDLLLPGDYLDHQAQVKHQPKSTVSPVPTIIVSRSESEESITLKAYKEDRRGLAEDLDGEIPFSILSLIQDPLESSTKAQTDSTVSSVRNLAPDERVTVSKTEIEDNNADKQNGYRASGALFKYGDIFDLQHLAPSSLLSPPPSSCLSPARSEQAIESSSATKKRRLRRNPKDVKFHKRPSLQGGLVYQKPLTISKTNGGFSCRQKRFHTGGRDTSGVHSCQSKFSTSTFHNDQTHTSQNVERLKFSYRGKVFPEEKARSMPNPQGNKQITMFDTSAATTVTAAITTTTAKTKSSASTTTTTSAATTVTAAEAPSKQHLCHIRKEETFVVTDWHNITGEERSPSENLRRRKALTLAKSNARHLLKQHDHQRSVRHQHDRQQQHQDGITGLRHRRQEQLHQLANYSHYNYLSRQLQLQLHQQQREQQQQQQQQQQSRTTAAANTAAATAATAAAAATTTAATTTAAAATAATTSKATDQNG